MELAVNKNSDGLSLNDIGEVFDFTFLLGLMVAPIVQN